MTDLNDKRINLSSNPEFRDGMFKVIQEISDLIIYNKKIKNNEPIPANLAERVMNFNIQASIDYALSDEYKKTIAQPSEELVKQTYQRFVQYDYSRPYNPEALNNLMNKNHLNDFPYLIRATLQFMMNIEKDEMKRPLQYYEKAYEFVTEFVEKYYNKKSQKIFTHYQRAALATYIVVTLKLVIPPKTKPSGGYTNADLVEISKNALKPVLKRF